MDEHEKPCWVDKHFSFFRNEACEYFPCHPTGCPEQFNCLFCYCPLYVLGPDCGGNVCYTEDGIKDCSSCMLPHKKENYGYVTARFQDIVARMKRLEGGEK